MYTYKAEVKNVFQCGRRPMYSVTIGRSYVFCLRNSQLKETSKVKAQADRSVMRNVFGQFRDLKRSISLIVIQSPSLYPLGHESLTYTYMLEP